MLSARCATGEAIPPSQALEGRAQVQETPVRSLQQPQHPSAASGEAEWTQQRDGAPHGREGGGTGQHLTALPRVEALQQGDAVQWASGFGRCDIEEGDGAVAVQPSHQGDLALAQRTATIVPDLELCHPL